MEATTKKKIKKTVGIVINVLLWLFVIFAVIVTVIAVSAGANKKNVPTVGGNCYLSVQSNSMNAEKPSWVGSDAPSGFKKGDLLIGRYIAEDGDAINALAVGDVITFEWDINGDGTVSSGEYNTHRIVAVEQQNGVVLSVETQGDNEEYSRGQTEIVSPSRIIAKYTGKKIGGVGTVITALSSSLGFGLCIVLPLALFFAYELFVFIRTLLKVKNDGKKMITAADEELIKQRAIEEYLRQQQEEQSEQEASSEQIKDDRQ